MNKYKLINKIKTNLDLILISLVVLYYLIGILDAGLVVDDWLTIYNIKNNIFSIEKFIKSDSKNIAYLAGALISVLEANFALFTFSGLSNFGNKSGLRLELYHIVHIFTLMIFFYYSYKIFKIYKFDNLTSKVFAFILLLFPLHNSILFWLGANSGKYELLFFLISFYYYKKFLLNNYISSLLISVIFYFMAATTYNLALFFFPVFIVVYVFNIYGSFKVRKNISLQARLFHGLHFLLIIIIFSFIIYLKLSIIAENNIKQISLSVGGEDYFSSVTNNIGNAYLALKEIIKDMRDNFNAETIFFAIVVCVLTFTFNKKFEKKTGIHTFDVPKLFLLEMIFVGILIMAIFILVLSKSKYGIVYQWAFGMGNRFNGLLSVGMIFFGIGLSQLTNKSIREFILIFSIIFLIFSLSVSRDSLEKHFLGSSILQKKIIYFMKEKIKENNIENADIIMMHDGMDYEDNVVIFGTWDLKVAIWMSIGKNFYAMPLRHNRGRLEFTDEYIKNKEDGDKLCNYNNLYLAFFKVNGSGIFKKINNKNDLLRYGKELGIESEL